MNILLIHQYFLDRCDGGGSRFNQMTRIWERAGHRITVISGMVHYATGRKYPQYKGKFIVREEVSPSILLYRCHVSEAYNKSFVGRLWAYFSFVFSSIVCLCRLHGRFDIILVTSPPLFVTITGMIASKIKKTPFVFEVRDLWPESAIDTGVLNNRFLIKAAYWLEKKAYQNATLINALTPAFRKKIIKEKGVNADKIIMIPNAADFSISDAVLEKCDRPALRKALGFTGRFVIIYVGAHGVANHLKQLLDTAEILMGTNALFFLVGEGMEKERLKADAIKRKLYNVRFFDAVSKENIFELIVAADAGTSALKRVEAFKTVYSNKTFDYMACKKPVLMAIDGVSRDLVESAQCGFYVEPENPYDFACKTRLYLADEKLVILHGENGYRYAKKHFDREKLACEYARMLELHCR